MGDSNLQPARKQLHRPSLHNPAAPRPAPPKKAQLPAAKIDAEKVPSKKRQRPAKAAQPKRVKVEGATTPKKKRDKNAPKRFRTAYQIYLAENVERVKEENPGMSTKDATKQVNTDWKTISQEEKERLSVLSDAEKERYKSAFAAYEQTDEYQDVNSCDAPVAVRTRKVRKPKDKNAPKRNLSAYFHFNKMNRERILHQNPDVKLVTEQTKLLGREWAALDEEGKKPYQALADEDKVRYTAELAAYNAQKDEEAAAAGPEVEELADEVEDEIEGEGEEEGEDDNENEYDLRAPEE